MFLKHKLCVQIMRKITNYVPKFRVMCQKPYYELKNYTFFMQSHNPVETNISYVLLVP